MPQTGTITAEKTKAGFDFEKEVAEIWRLFPDIKDEIFFIDLGTHKLVYPGDKEKAQRIREQLSENEYLLDTVRLYKEKIKNSAYVHGINGNFILVYTDKIKGNPWNDVFSGDQFRTFVFDHELAHALIPDGTAQATLSESIGDAYAMIRHFQRYGTETGSAEKVVQRRAAIFALGEGKDDDYRTKHFTSPVVEQILKLRDKIDWSALDIKQTAELAHKFALEFTPSTAAVSRFKNAFSAAAAYQGDDAGLGELAKILKKTNSPDVLKWGSAALQEALRFNRGGENLKEAWEKISKRTVAPPANDDGVDSFELVFGRPGAKPAVIANRR